MTTGALPTTNPFLDHDRLRQAFQQRFGSAATCHAAYAPGRVNLIGEHTDYNDGFVLPLAINMGTVAIGQRVDNPSFLTVYAANLDETCVITGQDKPPAGHWSAYVAGMVCRLQQLGYAVPGANLMLTGDIPIGSGLSSSASLECAVGLLLLHLAGVTDVDKRQLALAGQWAEHHYAGTQCGIMDQFAVALGQAGHALLIDCRSMAVQAISTNWPQYVLVVCHSRVSHALASSAYNQRRQECLTACRQLQAHFPEVVTLRDATVDMLNVLTDPVLYRRARHVLTENRRVLQAVDAMRENRLADVGHAMYASHVSMRDDYEVSCPELDCLVTAAQSVRGVLGARMTGGGFGGCTINLVHQDALPMFKQTVSGQYQQQFNHKPLFYITDACDGVRLLW